MDKTSQNPDANSDLELSVIIPARNEEQSLPACLASLVTQSDPGFFALGEQWEIIIVNDDSTDSTRGIATSFAAKHPRSYSPRRSPARPQHPWRIHR